MIDGFRLIKLMIDGPLRTKDGEPGGQGYPWVASRVYRRTGPGQPREIPSTGHRGTALTGPKSLRYILSSKLTNKPVNSAQIHAG